MQGFTRSTLALGAMLVLTGCPWWSPPEATDAAGMAGVLRMPDGSPVVGLVVETVESTVPTNDKGEFGLYYKPPDTHVHFRHEDAWYRRQYLESDKGTVVELNLPETRSLDVACGDFTCALQLHWDLADGFTARRNGKCKAGETTALPGSPKGEPRVSCKAKVTEPELDLSVRMDGDRLELLPPARNITVSVMADEPPTSCDIWVQGQELAEKGGAYIGSAAGDAVVQVVCDGRAAIPTPLPADQTALEVPWTTEGPVLRPPPGMELDRLQMTRAGTWTLEMKAGKSGGFALPPLPPGDYTVQLYTNEPSATPVNPPTDLKVGVVKGQLLSSGQYAAALKLERDLGDGVLEAMLTRD